ncbi:hypothetical protein AKJ16_DCAP00567 [Drosera capensis]
MEVAIMSCASVANHFVGFAVERLVGIILGPVLKPIAVGDSRKMRFGDELFENERKEAKEIKQNLFEDQQLQLKAFADRSVETFDVLLCRQARSRILHIFHKNPTRVGQQENKPNARYQ